MKPIYKKILKELEKGNAVLLEVNGWDRLPRYRIVTPTDCKYKIDKEEALEFSQSCFMNHIKATPLNIVTRMEEYDGENGLKIISIRVLNETNI